MNLMPLSQYLSIKTTRRWKSQQYTFIFLSQKHMNSSVMCQPLVWNVMDHLPLLQIITLVTYINDIMLIGLSEQEVAITLKSLVAYTCIRGWKIHPHIKGLYLSKILGIPIYEICRDIPSKMKDNLLQQALPTNKKHNFSGPICILETPHSWVPSCTHTH